MPFKLYTIYQYSEEFGIITHMCFQSRLYNMNVYQRLCSDKILLLTPIKDVYLMKAKLKYGYLPAVICYYTY